MYKLAAQQKLRISTSRGLLSVEQLYDLPIAELDSLAVKLEDDYKNSKGKSFIAKKTEKDKTIKLQFDIVLDVLTTKVELQEASQNAQEIKAHNQKILAKIADAQDKQLDNLSVKELEKLLK